MAEADSPPSGEPSLRTLAMPGAANPNGDIFGGWVLAQMDLAGAVPAVERAQGRVATVAVEAKRFHHAEHRHVQRRVDGQRGQQPGG
ncbi:MAG: hypothetical protein WD489_00810, partial [Rhodovibrionaceae bacterium]